MRISPEKCIGCGECLQYCNVEAIKLEGDIAVIDDNVCVECWICINNDVCPEGAFEKTPIETFEQVFQHVISDPTETHAGTDTPGRGTEEAKTNDVTGRFRKGEVGIAIDMGRPGVGCRMRDAETVAMAMAKAGVKLLGADHTPLAKLQTDLSTGKVRDDVLDMHVLSVIVEGKCAMEEFPGVLQAIRDVEDKIETVFSLGIVSVVDENGDTPVLDVIEKCGFPRPVRGKVNVGLGKPLWKED